MNMNKKIKIGMIFPGQGAQYVGMGKGLYDKERLVQDCFEEASNCLDQNFIRLCFASSERELMETVNAQTAIFLVSTSIYRLLHEKFGIIPDVVAGHSLGEYSAVYAAKGINFPDALYLLKKRALFMEEVTLDQKAAMYAILNLSESKLKEIVSSYDNGDDKVVEIVNYNSPDQFVISGTLEELENVKEDVKANGGRAIRLKVSGAFHSRLMKQAQEKFATHLEKVDFHDLAVPLINNVEAKVIKTAEELRSSLVKQISAPVLWWQSMQSLKDCDIIIEVGPGLKFSTILEREYPDKNIISINEQKDIDKLLENIKELSGDQDVQEGSPV